MSVGEAETYVIVGAGHAGCRAAEGMREAGFTGRIVMIGDEQHRPYERPPVSKQLLQDGADLESVFLQQDDYFTAQSIELRLGSPAVGIDTGAREVALGNGERVGFTKLLLATGSSPRRLPDAMGGNHLLYMRTIEDSLALRDRLQPGARVVLVGGGVIGLEVASVAASRGCQVTILEAADRLMGRAVCPEVSAYFHELHTGKGAIIEYGVSITGIEAAGGETLFHLEDGRTIAADVALAGIGVTPNTDLAEKAGLAVDGGIVVDEFGQTSAEGIYAAGEVTNHMNVCLGRRQRSETWLHADSHGRLVGGNMCGADHAYDELPWFWTDQYDVNMQCAGDPFGEETVARGAEGDPARSFFHLREGAIAGVTLINNGRDMRHAKKLIRAGAVIDPAVLADGSVPLKQVVADLAAPVDETKAKASA